MALRISGPGGAPPPMEPPIEELPVEEPIEEAPQEPLAGGGQVDPAAARYFGPESMCSRCIHYLDAPETGAGACEIVAGPIDPEGICSLFVADEVIEEPSISPSVDEIPPQGATGNVAIE